MATRCRPFTSRTPPALTRRGRPHPVGTVSVSLVDSPVLLARASTRVDQDVTSDSGPIPDANILVSRAELIPDSMRAEDARDRGGVHGLTQPRQVVPVLDRGQHAVVVHRLVVPSRLDRTAGEERQDPVVAVVVVLVERDQQRAVVLAG